MLRYNKNYITLTLNYMLKNLKGIILVLKIEKRDRKNDITSSFGKSSE